MDGPKAVSGKDCAQLYQHSLDLVGDGRSDSPGFTVKYGTFTSMNSKINENIDFSC